MIKDNSPLRLVGQSATARRLESRKEIEEWVAERSAVLTGLVEAERLDRAQATDRDHGQLRLDVEAAA